MLFTYILCKKYIFLCVYYIDNIVQSASWLTDCMMDAAESAVNGEDCSQEGSDSQVCILPVFAVYFCENFSLSPGIMKEK